MTVLLQACSANIELNPYVPDFQLDEARKYPTVSTNSPYMKEPSIVDLKTVDGMYCFPKEDIARLLREWEKVKDKSNSGFQAE